MLIDRKLNASDCTFAHKLRISIYYTCNNFEKVIYVTHFLLLNAKDKNEIREIPTFGDTIYYVKILRTIFIHFIIIPRWLWTNFTVSCDLWLRLIILSKLNHTYSISLLLNFEIDNAENLSVVSMTLPYYYLHFMPLNNL